MSKKKTIKGEEVVFSKRGTYLSINGGDPSEPMVAVTGISRYRGKRTRLNVQLPKKVGPVMREIVKRLEEISKQRTYEGGERLIFSILCPPDVPGRKELKKILATKGITLK